MTLADTTVLPTRFWAKVRVDFVTGCWDWIGALNSVGRPCWSIQSRAVLAYRIAWEAFRGRIPAGMTVDHLCGNKVCVNPAHMEIVSRSVNSKRGRPEFRLVTAPEAVAPDVVREVRDPNRCIWGHDLTVPGARTTNPYHGKCRVCKREQQAAWKARARAASKRVGR